MGLANLLATPSAPGHVHRAGFGWINVGGRVYEHDCIVSSRGVSSPWWRKQRHVFSVSDLERIVDLYAPDCIVLGCGWMGMLQVENQVQVEAHKYGVRWMHLRTPDAVAIYNHQSASYQHPVLALHVTC